MLVSVPKKLPQLLPFGKRTRTYGLAYILLHKGIAPASWMVVVKVVLLTPVWFPVVLKFAPPDDGDVYELGSLSLPPPLSIILAA